MPFPWGQAIGGITKLFDTSITQKTQASDNATQVAIARANADSKLASAHLSANSLNKLIPLILGGLAVVVILVLVIKKK